VDGVRLAAEGVDDIPADVAVSVATVGVRALEGDTLTILRSRDMRTKSQNFLCDLRFLEKIMISVA